MVDLNSQIVCDLLWNVLTGFLTMTWLIWTLSLCVICSQIHWPDFWPWHGWFGLSVCEWLALKSTDLISDHDMVDLDSQQVRDLLWNLLTQFLTMTWLIWTPSLCVICSQIHWLDFWLDFWLWHGWFGLLGSAWLALKSTDWIWPWHGGFWLSVCAQFTLKSTDLISDYDMVDLDSQIVCDLLWKCTDQISDSDMVDLDSQAVCDWLWNLLTGFLTMTWLIWTLSGCVTGSQTYWPDF